MIETEELNALQAAFSSYLTALGAVADCVGAACPETGGPYRHRLRRLRSRLAFDVTPEAIAESTVVVERELEEYSRKTAGYIAQHGVELRRTVEALDALAKQLAQRQDFYNERLQQFAAQMRTTPGTSPSADGLPGLVENMSHDTQSLVARMGMELAQVSASLKDAQITDPVTGLMNRKEMQRQIDRRRAAGVDPVLLAFELSGDICDEIAQQVAERLCSHFRHLDLICRWTENEFLVMFQGTREMAEARLEQIVPWITGKYALDNGESIAIRAEAGLVAPHLLENAVT
jgi:GGDEF domain-containing protein